MGWAESSTADRLQIKLGKRILERRRILRHVADGAEADAPLASLGVFLEHAAPVRMSRIVSEFDTRRARRIANLIGRILSPK